MNVFESICRSSDIQSFDHCFVVPHSRLLNYVGLCQLTTTGAPHTFRGSPDSYRQFRRTQIRRRFRPPLRYGGLHKPGGGFLARIQVIQRSRKRLFQRVSPLAIKRDPMSKEKHLVQFHNRTSTSSHQFHTERRFITIFCYLFSISALLYSYQFLTINHHIHS